MTEVTANNFEAVVEAEEGCGSLVGNSPSSFLSALKNRKDPCGFDSTSPLVL
jgi:hypothetical protein